MAKPLFIPLRREFFEAFAAGTKTHEWRRLGVRWNAGTCWVGRDVVLSRGYSGARLRGILTGFDVRPAEGAVADLYGAGTLCAVLSIRITGVPYQPSGGRSQRSGSSTSSSSSSASA